MRRCLIESVASPAIFGKARFYSCVLDDEHLAHAVRYVERNPVRAGTVSRAEDYPWSSAGSHVRGEVDRYLNDGLPLLDSIEDWSAWLAGDDERESIQMIRVATTGRVCGSEEFIKRIELETHRYLRPKPRGRKAQQSGENGQSTPLPLVGKPVNE